MDYNDVEEFLEGNPMNSGVSGNKLQSQSSVHSNRPQMPIPKDIEHRRSLTPPRNSESSSTVYRDANPQSRQTPSRRESASFGYPQPLPSQRKASLSPTTKYQKQNVDEKNDDFGHEYHFDEEAEVKPSDVDLDIKNPKKSNAKNISKGSDESPRKTMNQALTSNSIGREFKGNRILQYAVWAHYMGYGNVLLSITLGVFAIIWIRADTYHCKLDGQLIHPNYLPGTCNQVYQGRLICCEPDALNNLKDLANVPIGILYILYGIFILFYENVDYGYGLWLPSDSLWFRLRISPIGITHFAIGVVGLACDATALAGGCLIMNGIVYLYASYRRESGDGGRAYRKKISEQAKTKNEEVVTWTDRFNEILTWNPITFYRRIYNEDKLSTYVWLALFFIANILTYFVTLNEWFTIVDSVADGLKNGNLVIDCDLPLCKATRKMIRFGPVSGFAPWAKAAGQCLNLNGALILLPVIRNVLRKLNNSGVSFSNARNQTDYFAKFFAHPLTRYIPLQKNIEFHKLCAGAILFFSYIHMICHYFNLITANAATLQLFRFARWGGTQFLLGSIVSFAMFMIYTAAPEEVRMAKYEIFFKAHHFYIVFFLMMFLHGPVFIYWAILPVLLYALERYLQLYRGNRPYLVEKVEWIEPVMAIYFRPVFKEDFPFKEGQYLYLNCPAISNSEWHPFTISSASDDLHFGPRVLLETGEEVVEVPRPSSVTTGGKWNKYCLASKDWRSLSQSDYIDKSETGYLDYVSVHIKVQGLDEPVALSWTRKLKEYFELLSPGGKFPFYFSRRDLRGDIAIGRQFGPDSKTPILRVDGPHSAPSEHYTNYGTVMLIGAGIGLTPCASILSALAKYRWKKNFSPEILHFYWIVRQNEVDSFQWLIHMLTDLSFQFKTAKEANQIEGKYYMEINIYVTGVEKTPRDVKPLYRAKKETMNFGHTRPTFTADQLYEAMLNPSVDSRGQIDKMKRGENHNRFQDVWVWNGRPHWDEIFKEVRLQRQHSDIGVCFCGAAVIGADLRSMCEKYSSAEDDCLFTLHKENF